MEQPKHILIVEDDQQLSEPLVAKLKGSGFRVTVAHDGAAGFAQAMELRPDLILLDLVMPKLDGFGMLKKLRKDTWGGDVPVIIMTNRTDSQAMAMRLQFGVYDYVIKAETTLENILERVRSKLASPPAAH